MSGNTVPASEQALDWLSAVIANVVWHPTQPRTSGRLTGPFYLLIFPENRHDAYLFLPVDIHDDVMTKEIRTRLVRHRPASAER
jgi:hypothetical protein